MLTVWTKKTSFFTISERDTLQTDLKKKKEKTHTKQTVSEQLEQIDSQQNGHHSKQIWQNVLSGVERGFEGAQ